LRSHHPEIYDAGVDDFKALRKRLRDMRDKESTLAHAKRREMRGKGPPRGESFPRLAEHPLKRRQVFAAAVKRVNREIDRMQKLEASSRTPGTGCWLSSAALWMQCVARSNSNEA
jgi:hypothetical protein